MSCSNNCRGGKKLFTAKLFNKFCMVLMILWILPSSGVFCEDTPSFYHHEKPHAQFSSPIGNKTFTKGKIAYLHCFVDNLGTDQVAWLRVKDTTFLSVGDRVTLKNSRIRVLFNSSSWTLQINDLEESDRGCYACIVNTLEEIRQFGCIDIEELPANTTQHSNSCASAAASNSPGSKWSFLYTMVSAIFVLFFY